MHFAREGYPRIFGLGVASLTLNLLGFQTAGLLLLLLTLFVAFFFRDPDRTALADDRLILAPADGRVVTVEQNMVTIEDAQGRRIVLVQVAGMLARRIVCALKGGDRVCRGHRYGMIMLGSRVDLYCPAEVTLRVQVGQRVKAGETVIGIYP